MNDLTVVIPTRDRWEILRRTLDGLLDQTVQGFQIVVSVDGEEPPPEPLGDDITVVNGRAGGSAVARNRGIHAADTGLLLLLDDDMIPEPQLVAHHLAVHRSRPEPTVAVLGRAVWHPELEQTRISRWLDWSSMMFPYEQLHGRGGDDVGWGRFATCNVSVKRDLLDAVGGLDETFVHYYEDTDLAKRLGTAGMELIYEPRAVSNHLQQFTFDDVRRRFERVALGERLMERKHPDFEAWFRPRMQKALDRRPDPLGALWPRLVDHVPARMPTVRRAVRARAHREYLRRLAPGYLGSYERSGVLVELIDHLRDDYDPMMLIHSEAEVDAEEMTAASEEEFYRTSRAYPYDLTVFEISGTKDPYLNQLAEFLPPGASVLDYGCGIGSDGLAMASRGFRPSFADFDNPSVAFLRDRLRRRGMDADIYDLDGDDVPGGFDAVLSYDVIEHLDDPFAYLTTLESLGRLVSVNFLEADPHDTHLHRPLPIDDLLRHARARGLLSYRRHHGRSHVVVYRGAHGDPVGRARSWTRYGSGTTRRMLSDRRQRVRRGRGRRRAR